MTINAVSTLNWSTYQNNPSNLIAQYRVDFGLADTWSFQPSGTVKGSVNQVDTNATATGVVIDNTSSKYAVTVSVGVTFIETIPPYSKGVVQLGGSSPYVKIQGQGSCLATFFYGVFPGSFVGQNQVAANMAAIGAYLPSGIMMEWGGLVGTIPAGWIYCNGAAISRVTYSDLFNAIGTSYGAGDGASTFNLPDRRGKFVRGFDDGAGVDPGRALFSNQGSFVGDHQHRLPMGFDTGSIYLWEAPGGAPITGSEVITNAGSLLVTVTGGEAQRNIRIGWTDSTPIRNPGTGDNRPVNTTGIFMIKS